MRRRFSRSLILFVSATIGVAVALPATASPAGRHGDGQGTGGGISKRTLDQIAALQRAKAARTPDQRKVDSRLLAEVRIQRRVPLATGVARANTGVETTKSGLTAVDIHWDITTAGSASAKLGSRVEELGGTVRSSHPREGVLRADVPITAVEKLAAQPGLQRIEPAADATTLRVRPPDPGPKAKRERAEALASDRRADRTLAGAVTSEADVVHAVDTARERFGVTGTGVKVCALSDGVNSLAEEQESGELPPDVDILPGQAGTGDEGTALLELIHDLAPNARLGFATAFAGVESFAQNIRDLRAAGCDILIDDILYFNESPFQDGPIARAVNDVTADGALYFSSAGNQGNLADGTSGTYEGDYVDSGVRLGKLAGFMHDFDPGPDVQVLNPISPPPFFGGAPITLFWSDPLGAASNDYDVYVIDGDGDVVAFSDDFQDGDDDPYERAQAPFGTDLSLAVVKFAGADRFLHLDAFGERFQDRGELTGFATGGAVRGHSAAAGAFAVAAVPAAEPLPFDLEPGDPPNPSGPHPGTFGPDQQSERFTADGPRRVFYTPDGTPITPGDLSATGGTVRPKPDITAADGVSTGLPAFTPFFGTSASAPHAGAIAALVVSGNPGISPAEVREALTTTAIDIEADGPDRVTGAGIVMADRTLTYTGATPQPYVTAGEATAVPVAGDGDPYFEPGEVATVVVPLTNTGDANAARVSVNLRSATPGVTVTPTNRGYGRVNRGVTKTRPFTVELAPDYTPGRPVELAAKVAFIGGFSPTRSTIEVATGEPAGEVVHVAYTGDPVEIPDNDPGGAAAEIAVDGVGYASRVTFSVDGTECDTTIGSETVGISHTFVGDLVGSLVAPDGTSVTLFSRAGSSGNNVCQAVFDDAAETSFQSVGSGDAPYTGTWSPAAPLAGFAGTLADGTWKFQVTDNAALDSGSIRAVSLHVSGFVR